MMSEPMTQLEEDLTAANITFSEKMERMWLENKEQRTALAEAMLSADSAEARMEGLVREVVELGVELGDARRSLAAENRLLAESLRIRDSLRREVSDLEAQMDLLLQHEAALARADATIVWFEKRKAASEALIEAAHKALSRMDPSNATWQLNEAIEACRDAFK